MKQVLLSPLQKHVEKAVIIPGSKSVTIRALLLAALTKEKVLIKNPLFSDDTQALISCLQTFGIQIERIGENIHVIGNIQNIKNKQYILDAKLSGLTIRFLLALTSIIPGEKIITGDEGLKKRPVKDLVEALRQLGVEIIYLDQEGFPPIKVSNSLPLLLEEGGGEVFRLKQNLIGVSGSTSSQFISALLMIAPILNISIKVFGTMISQSYVELTKNVMESFGVEVIEKNKTFTTKGVYNAKEFTVEGDFSSACYFAAIAALAKSKISLKNLNPNSVQGDKEFLAILSSMGNEISKTKAGITILGKGVKSVVVDMTNCPDQIQTLAVLAAFGKGETKITGISSLRVKETDRVTALVTELKKMGITVEIKADEMIIHGGNPHAATIDTYSDHRMAMAFAVAGAALSGMRINNPDVVTKTFPDFWKELKKIGVKVQLEKRNHPSIGGEIPLSGEGREVFKKKSNIILIGFMGTGKSSVAPLLARKLKYEVIEMDELILRKSKKESINEIFAKDGEDAFRKLEYLVAKLLQQKSNYIISAGGGVVMNSKTMEELTPNAIIVFLSTEFETIKKRLVDTSDRPLWKNTSQTKKLFELRQPMYETYADIIISTDGKSLGMITNEIIEKLEKIL